MLWSLCISIDSKSAPSAVLPHTDQTIRSAIAGAFEKISHPPGDELTEEEKPPLDHMPLDERMRDWWERTGDDIPPDVDSELKELADIEEEEHLSLYSDVLETSGYRWLSSRLQRELRLVVPTGSDRTKFIGQAIKFVLPERRRVSRKASPGSYLLKLKLDWDVLGFFEEQFYMDEPDESFDGVIVLTGSDMGVQATTTSQYIRQTWPMTGEECSKILKEALGQDKESHEWARGEWFEN